MEPTILDDKKTYITDHMLFIGFGLAVVYWLCESFLNIFLSNNVNMFELVFGNNLDEIWARLIVLCLFVIFGSHAQFTIDNRKKAEAALKNSEERYRTLVDNIPIGMCRVTPGEEGALIMANPAFLRMFDVPPKTRLEKISIWDIFLTPADSRRFMETLEERNSLFWNEAELKTLNGETVWGAVTARLVEEGEAPYIDCTFEDIDERKKAALKIAQDEETRRRFERLMSPDLAEMIVSGNLEVVKGGEERVATVLFIDIRGFTTLSENTEASEVVQMLNEYFETMVEIIFRHEGTVDKFIGDAIMVIWGAPIVHGDDPLRAVNAALEMRSAMSEFNRARSAAGKQPIRVGIGINTGRLVAGYIGASRTMSYSVIGDTVNTASRLCSAARSGQIIISESTFEAVKPYVTVTRLDPIHAKGKLHPIQVYNVLDNHLSVAAEAA